jgi:uncharacterized protein YydD (DUF2326 family)
VSESKHPPYGVIATSFAFAMALWFLTDTFLLAPLKDKNSELERKINNIESNVKNTDAYKNLQREVINFKESTIFYKDKALELNKQVSLVSDLKSENMKLREILLLFKKEISNRNETILELEKNGNILHEIETLQEEQRKYDVELSNLISYSIISDKDRLNIIRIESRIKMLQEQITTLSSRINKNT